MLSSKDPFRGQERGMNRSLSSFESHDKDGAPTRSSVRATKGRERDGGGEFPGPVGPVAPEGQQAVPVRSQMCGSGMYDQAFDLQQVGLLLAARTGPYLRGTRQAPKPQGDGSRLASPSYPPQRPSPQGGSPHVRLRREPTICLIQGTRDIADAGGDRSPRARCRCRTKQDNLPRCEKGIARTARGPYSCTRSPLAAPSVTARWKSTACGRSPSRLSRSATRRGWRCANLARR